MQYERDIRDYIENKWRVHNEQIKEDRTKNKEKFVKVNEALTVLEQYLQQKDRKLDRTVAAEIQSRHVFLRSPSHF